MGDPSLYVHLWGMASRSLLITSSPETARHIRHRRPLATTSRHGSITESTRPCISLNPTTSSNTCTRLLLSPSPTSRRWLVISACRLKGDLTRLDTRAWKGELVTQNRFWERLRAHLGSFFLMLALSQRRGEAARKYEVLRAKNILLLTGRLVDIKRPAEVGPAHVSFLLEQVREWYPKLKPWETGFAGNCCQENLVMELQQFNGKL